MAKLFELCSDVPQKLVMVQRANVVAERMAAVYDRRMSYLDTEQAIFEQCKRNRSKKRVHNTFSTEEAGRFGGGTFIATCRQQGTTEITEERGAKYHKKSVRTYSVHNYGAQACRVSADRY